MNIHLICYIQWSSYLLWYLLPFSWDILCDLGSWLYNHIQVTAPIPNTFFLLFLSLFAFCVELEVVLETGTGTKQKRLSFVFSLLACCCLFVCLFYLLVALLQTPHIITYTQIWFGLHRLRNSGCFSPPQVLFYSFWVSFPYLMQHY